MKTNTVWHEINNPPVKKKIETGEEKIQRHLNFLRQYHQQSDPLILKEIYDSTGFPQPMKCALETFMNEKGIIYDKG